MIDQPPKSYWARLEDIGLTERVTNHEVAHLLGMPHLFAHPLAYIGSALHNVNVIGSSFPAEGVTSYNDPANERDQFDRWLTAGRYVNESDSNNSLAQSMVLDDYLAEMRADNSPRNERVIVNGAITSASDQDFYAFTAAAGEKFSVDIDSAEFQNPLDAAIRMYDADGNLVAWNADALDRETGIASVDPYVTFSAGAAGMYYVEVLGTNGTVGSYRLKVTPEEAWDRTGPRVLAFNDNGRLDSSITTQLSFRMSDQIDPATLRPENVTVVGQNTGAHSGTAWFDPVSFWLYWETDSPLPMDNYTVTLKSGAHGITDLRGNMLDGETDGSFAFPEISGDEAVGGDFVTTLWVNSAATLPASVSGVFTFSPNPTGIGFMRVSFSADLETSSIQSGSFVMRSAGLDGEFSTFDDEIVPVDAYPAGASQVDLYQRGFFDEGVQSLSVGSLPYDLELGDLNEDGVADLVAAAQALSGTIRVSLGTGNGQFGPSARYDAGQFTAEVELADLDNDGHLDVIATNKGTGNVSIFWGRGDGTFEAAVSLSTGDNPTPLVVQDLNADGLIDFAVASGGGQQVDVFLNEGNRSFATPDTYSFGNAQPSVNSIQGSIAVDDFNEDGVPDLVVGRINLGDHYILLGEGDGTFSGPTITQDDNAGFSVTGDFNGDGHADLAAARNIYTSNAATDIAIWFGNGDGTFQFGDSIDTSDSPLDITVTDFNADGNQDLVVITLDSLLTIYLGRGDGGFDFSRTYATGAASPAHSIAQDINNDGVLDLLVSDSANSKVMILPGQGDGTLKIPQFRVEGLVRDRAGNTIQVSTPVGLQASPRAPFVTQLNIQPNTVVQTAVNRIEVTFSRPVDVATLTTSSFQLRYSPDPTFFDGNDSFIADANDAISWDQQWHRAVFESETPLGEGYYLLELSGVAGGIAGLDGRLLDGEYLDYHINGNHFQNSWDWAPSGNGSPGGDYRAAFRVQFTSDAPQFVSMSSATTFLENDPPLILQPNLEVRDFDSGNFEGGQLTIQITTHASSQDRLTIRNQGLASGEVSVSGSRILVGGLEVGSFTGGDGNIPFVLTFSRSASAESVQAVARSIQFANTSRNIENLPKSVELRLTDGDGGTVAATMTLNVTAVNDVPVATASSVTMDEDTATTFVIGDFPFTDIESDSLVSITISNLTLASGDTLTVNQGSGAVAVTNGMTITAAQIASLTYTPKGNANGNTRTTFDFTVNDADNGTVSATMSINVTTVNDAPVRTAGSLGAITVNEDSANTTAVTLGLAGLTYAAGPGTATDESSQTLTYTVTTIPAFVKIYKADGTTEVTAGDTVSAAELVGLKYKTLADVNGSGNLVLTITDSGSNSAPNVNTLVETLTLTVAAVNDVPVRTAGALAAITVNEDSANTTAVTLGLAGLTYAAGPGTATDESSQTLTYTVTTIPALVKIFKADGTTEVAAGNTVTAAELAGLKYKTLADVNGSGKLVLTITDSGSSTAPNANRLVETLSVTVTAVNDAPVLTRIETTFVPYAPNGSGRSITSALNLVDIDNTTMSGATVQISDGFQNGDVLGFTNTGNITGIYDGTGTLTLSGIDTVANYQAALRSVTYSSSSQSPLERTVSIQVNDGDLLSNVVTRTIGGTTQLLGTTLNVYGNPTADIITVSEAASLKVVVNGTIFNYTPASVTAVKILSFAGNDKITVNSLKAGTALTANGGDDNDTLNVLNGVTVDTTLLGGSGNDNLTGGRGNDTLKGGSGNDTYVFRVATGAETDTVTEIADQGTDTLSFAALKTNVRLNLASAAPQSVHANRILKLSSGGTFENALGGSGNDTLIGNLRNNRLTGNAGNDRLTGNAGSDVLVGGTGNDTYVFGTASAFESDTVTETANSGIDTLNFGALKTAVNLNLGTTTRRLVHVNRRLKLSSGVSIEKAIGGSGNDILTGNGLANRLTGNAGNDRLTGNAGNDVLVGGKGNDAYVFGIASGKEFDTALEASNAGIDTLHFGGLKTAVNLNLAIATSQQVHTNRELKLNSGSTFENAVGGSGNDLLRGNSLDNTLTGNNGHDILIGNAGDDQLLGGAGRDILIGGLNLDLLDGGNSDDILIAGRTAIDASITKLKNVRTAWISSKPYLTRVANLRAGVGTPNSSLKAGFNVLDDAGEIDSLTGNSGRDWCFILDDIITDLASGELIDLL